jgi:hypothetical protein
MATRVQVEDPLTRSGQPEMEDFSGLCRVCGREIPRVGDPNSWTPSLCSERCLARVIVDFWAGFGLEARVSLRDGFARLEGIRGILPPPDPGNSF